jgi:hypothetical protein
LEVDDLDGANGFYLDSAVGVGFGVGRFAGDINGDGYADLALYNHILFGGPGIGAAGAAILDDGSPRSFRLMGLRTGMLIGVGDLNGDGLDDLARAEEVEVEGWCGVSKYDVHVIFGRRLADLDADDDVDLSDLARLLAHYGQTGTTLTYADGDLDYDHDVDLSDLAILLAQYGKGR